MLQDWENINISSAHDKNLVVEKRLSALDQIAKQATNAKHSSGSQEWYTPTNIIESARKVLGIIDLDPASSVIANQTVKAWGYYTKETDGLKQEWFGNVFCNPPGGKIKNKSIPVNFWTKLVNSPRVEQAIFLAFSIELLQTSQRINNDACKHTICIPDRRLSFTDVNGQVVKGNTHASAIVYYSNTVDNTDAFIQEFKQYGTCMQWVGK